MLLATVQSIRAHFESLNHLTVNKPLLLMLLCGPVGVDCSILLLSFCVGCKSEKEKDYDVKTQFHFTSSKIHGDEVWINNMSFKLFYILHSVAVVFSTLQSRWLVFKLCL